MGFSSVPGFSVPGKLPVLQESELSDGNNPGGFCLGQLATRCASLTKPSSDCIYEMLCLLSNEPTLFKVEAHSIDPGLTAYFSSGSTENTIYIP